MRGTISLDELPKPSVTGMYLYIGDAKTFDGVVRRLEELGWLWVGPDNLKPTKWHPSVVGGKYPFDLCLGHASVAGAQARLTWAQDGSKGMIVSGIVKAVSNLKAENTRPDAVVCAACGSKLANPMPWIPRLKHCPKCEP